MLDQFLEFIPAEKQEDYKRAIGSAIVLNSREDAAKYIAEHPLLKSERDAIISRTTANYAEKFQTEKLPSLVEEEVRKRNPPKDPRDIEIAEMKAKFANMERQALLKDRHNAALKKTTELGLPAEFAEYVIDEDENVFLSKLEKLTGVAKSWLDTELQKHKVAAVGNQATPKQGENQNTLQSQYQKAMDSGNIAVAMAIKAQIAQGQ